MSYNAVITTTCDICRIFALRVPPNDETYTSKYPVHGDAPTHWYKIILKPNPNADSTKNKVLDCCPNCALHFT